MARAIWLVPVLTGVCGPVANAQSDVVRDTPSYHGDSGLFHMPSASVLPRGKVAASLFRDNVATCAITIEMPKKAEAISRTSGGVPRWPRTMCRFCSGTLERATGDFSEWSAGAGVHITDVPSLRCRACGEWEFPQPILRRLRIIFARARAYARKDAASRVVWVWTPQGPPQVGGLPGALRSAFARLFVSVSEERRLRDASVRARRARPDQVH